MKGEMKMKAETPVEETKVESRTSEYCFHDFVSSNWYTMATPKSKDSKEALSQSSTSGSSSLISPFSSPVAQVKHHGAGNLTGDLRKVKDTAADFHNLTMKWNALNSQGMDIVTRIANIKIEKVFNVQDLSEDSQQTQQLPPELNPLCDLLSGVVDAMEKIEVKLRSKVEMMEGLIALKQFQKLKSESESPVLFVTMTLQDVACTVRSVYEMYSKELHFKRQLCGQIAHAGTRDTMMFYSVSWMHQPYIDCVAQDFLRALLKETGHVK
ncbi:cyclin-dependent kinase 2-interacting protein [Aplysia californica]|uniref:Cyclin-dependent kinase 2-interacting protein n=1 Tax=Aplysia californica TaxID=6500 RepID=A0ABM0JGD3_APLCA|nr:cyclin-dependent kinase 2-interacting protein [Aplysia californica]